MSIRRVIVCEVQVPFVHGGAEYHVRALHQQLRARGFEAELVSVPFKWYPKREILAHAAAWRLIDLSESNGEPRSEERRVGKECQSVCRSRWSPYH